MEGETDVGVRSAARREDKDRDRDRSRSRERRHRDKDDDRHRSVSVDFLKDGVGIHVSIGLSFHPSGDVSWMPRPPSI